MKKQFFLFSVFMNAVFADNGGGIIGGTTVDFPSLPLAYLISPEGDVTPLGSGLFTSYGSVNSVAINNRGVALIGGSDLTGALPPFAFLVSSTGSLTPLGSGTFPTPAQFETVAINEHGFGVIGGNSVGSTPIAYLVSPEGILTSLNSQLITFGEINSVAINNKNICLLGGDTVIGPVQPLGFLVSPEGAFTCLGSSNGVIPILGITNSVAINDHGIGLMGGGSLVFPETPFAYLVSPDGTLTPLGVGVFPSLSTINSVAINDRGVGILGGEVGSGEGPYAYLVSAENGTLTAIGSGIFPTVGSISSVAINASGTCLIGGAGDQVPLAYFVSPKGTFLPINAGAVTQEDIINVSLADNGLGLIVGSSVAFLVDPQGNLQNLNIGLFQSNLGFQTAAIDVAPSAFGPYSSFANALFALGHSLEAHYTDQKRVFQNTRLAQKDPLASVEGAMQGLRCSTTLPQVEKKPCLPKETFTPWISFVGDIVQQSKQQQMPKYTNEILGVLAACDYNGLANSVLGTGLAYTFNYVHYDDKSGHAQVHQEYAMFYGAFSRPYFYFNAAIWGGVYQCYNERHSIVQITSKSNSYGWFLDPHVELSTPFSCDIAWLMIDPFAMIDWVNIWQNSFHEHGQSGFNIGLNGQYSSLLRSEVGMRFYQDIQTSWGLLRIKEKGSYLNKTPFHAETGSAFFIGALATFPIQTLSREMQNLGVVELAFTFVPSNCKLPYFLIDSQGEFGPDSQSYLCLLEIGKHF